MSYLHDLIVPGLVLPFAGSAASSGWLLCNGQAVSRTTYAALFAVIGTTYGVGNGTTTFNVPDLRGEFVRGLDNGRGVDAGRTIGSSQGATTVRSGGIDSTADATWARPAPAVNNPDSSVSVGPSPERLLIAKTQTTTEAPSGMIDHAVRPRNVAVNYIIKT